MFATLSKFVSSATSQLTAYVPTAPVQNVKDKVQSTAQQIKSLPQQTKDYLYPKPEEKEMKSVVRLDDAFFVTNDIEDYTTPGQQQQPQSQQSQPLLNNNLNINDIPIKPSGNADQIQSWHEFDLCVEDDGLFSTTDTSSYTTTNISVTTANTSVIMSPNYNINKNKKQHQQQQQLNNNNNNYNDPNIDLNLYQDNADKLFRKLHEFRKSIIDRRKKSGVYQCDSETDLTAPPTLKSDGSYHRRLKTLDIDELNLNADNLAINSDNNDNNNNNKNGNKNDKNINNKDDDDKAADISPIAPPNGQNGRRIYHHAIEGSHDLGVDGLKEADLRRNLSKDISLTDDDQVSNNNDDKCDDKRNVVALVNGNDDDNNIKHIKNISISKKNVNDNELNFVLGIGSPDTDQKDNKDNNNADVDDKSFLELQEHFSIRRNLQQPRTSLKVSRISVSDELKQTLMHQKSISNGVNNVNNNDNKDNKDDDDISPQTSASASSFDQLQNQIGDYVKRVSLTPRGVDPDNAKVTVSSVSPVSTSSVPVAAAPVFSHQASYTQMEYLKKKNKKHRKNDSMDTQPDNNSQAPYINKQVTVIVKDKDAILNSLDMLDNPFNFPSSSDDDDDNGQSQSPPNLVNQQTVLIRQQSQQFYDHDMSDVLKEKLKNDKQKQINDKKDMKDVKDVQDKQDQKDPASTKEGWAQTGFQNDEKVDDLVNVQYNIISPQRSLHSDKIVNIDNDNHSDEKYDQLFDISSTTSSNSSTNSSLSSTDLDDDDDGKYTGTTTGGYNTLGLGLVSNTIWNENEYLPQELDESYDERIVPRFNINSSLNNIIKFWDGDIYISTDCIVIPITETWNPISRTSHELMNSAGSQYLEYIYSLKSCGEYVSTGDSIYCSGYNLPSKYIINTTPPRYDDRYPVASENAIHSCYWRSLEISSDLGCKSIIFPSIYPPKFFSEQLAIHIFARTLRRFLERYGNNTFTSIIIYIESSVTLELYTRIFTIYFPRDDIDLKYSQKYMPSYTGNHSGGTNVRLRTRNISLTPLSSNSNLLHNSNNNNILLKNKYKIDYETYDIYGNLRSGIHSIAEYKESPEKVWKLREKKKWSWQKIDESFRTKYSRYWNKCRKLKFLDIQIHQFLYNGGQDRDGRDIIIFVGNRFPAKLFLNNKKHNLLKKSLLYIIYELHHIVDNDYIIIYLHSKFNEDNNLPPISWINQSFQICSNKFNKNLCKFYIIHPNFRLKSWFYILSTKLFYSKIIYLDSIIKLELYNIDLENIALPGKSWEYERELYGDDILADKIALTSDDLVLDALPYH